MLEDTRTTIKLDYFAGLLVLCTGVGTVIDNLIAGVELDSCFNVFNRMFFYGTPIHVPTQPSGHSSSIFRPYTSPHSDMARFCIADVVEDALRRWVFYKREGGVASSSVDDGRDEQSAVARRAQLFSKICSVSVGVLVST